jgi:ligand-binding sensor domain-containing protein
MGMVRNVKQARNGDILVASYLGVFRYDGTTFTNMTSRIISPRYSSFWAVLEDRKGNLWFGSKDSGVYVYNGGTFQHFTTKDGLASNMALHLYEDRAGNIWIGSSLYNGISFRKLTTKDGFPSNQIRLLLEDRSGKLWFGAQGEDMFVYDGKDYTVLRNNDGKAFNNVWSVVEDKKGNFWFGDASGLWRFDGITYTKVSEKGASAIIEDKQGNIWTTGADEPPQEGQKWSLSRYDAASLYKDKPTVTKLKLQTGMLLGILEDAKGNIWFGSGDGVYRYDGKTITNFREKVIQK